MYNTNSLFSKIIIGVVAVVLALSLALPYLGASTNSMIGTGNNNVNGETPVNLDPGDAVNTSYAERIEQLEEKIEATPDDISLQKDIADAYLEWGAAYISWVNSTPEAGVWDKSIAAYDTYLAGAKAANQSEASIKEATVDRMIALYYSGDEDVALSELQTYVKDDPEFSPAWYNLGLLYYEMGDKVGDDDQTSEEKAKEAFMTAAETDPENEFGNLVDIENYLERLDPTYVRTTDPNETEDETDPLEDSADGTDADGTAGTDAGTDADSAAGTDADGTDGTDGDEKD